jgi:hypothetical protein
MDHCQLVLLVPLPADAVQAGAGIQLLKKKYERNCGCSFHSKHQHKQTRAAMARQSM